ncbi:MAG TPA: hypothetical protein VIM64_25145, partial [Puia sp.]
TAWMGENHFSRWPVILYGVVLIMNGMAYNLLCRLLVRQAGEGSTLAVALGKDWKGKLSVVIYLLAIALAFINPWISSALYVLVAMIWFIPDRRIEKNLSPSDEE